MERTSKIKKIVWKPIRSVLPGAKAYRSENVKLTVFVESHLEGLHISVSHADRVPTWDELSDAKESFAPDEMEMMILFPRKSQYVNLHERTMHLWEYRGQK